MRSETSKAVATAAPNMTPQEFAHFGDGSLAYVKTIASGIPQRCERYFGVFPTTANPLLVIGRSPEGGAQVTASAALGN